MPEKGDSRVLKDTLRIYGPAFFVAIVGFVIAYQFVDPAPPERIVIATAAEDGAYHSFALRYRELLARHGVELELRSTAGSVENIDLLRDESEDVDVAFVQGGIATQGAEPPLYSLASLYFEPLWVFHRRELELESLGDLAGKRLAVGAEGSGTRAVALKLLAENGVPGSARGLLPLGGQAAAQELLSGDIDAVFLVASPSAPAVDELLRSDRVTLLSFRRAEAYTRVHRFLSNLSLPEGVLDFEADIPAVDKVLLAPAATLVARADFHPALTDLLLQAASRVHGRGGLFEAPGEFPSTLYLDLPLSDEAERHFKYGPPFLQRYLPFWAATLIARLKVMLVPLLALLFPLFKVLPPTYRWRVRSRIYRWYRELLEMDAKLHGSGEYKSAEIDLARLDRLESDVAKIHIPLSYADELYALRMHIDLMRRKIEKARSGSG